MNRFKLSFCHRLLYFILICSTINLAEAKGGGGGYRGYGGGGGGGDEDFLQGRFGPLMMIGTPVLLIFLCCVCGCFAGASDEQNTNKCNPDDEWKSPAKYYQINNEDIDIEGKIQPEDALESGLIDEKRRLEEEEIRESELLNQKRLQEEKEQEERMKEMEAALEGQSY